jgi:hypothetical protein
MHSVSGTSSRNPTIVLALAITIMLCSCSTVRQVRPLDKGESSVTFSVGGPITQVGKVYFPLPLLSVGYNRGIIAERLDIETGLHLTQLAYGILDFEAGVNVRPLPAEGFRPGINITPKAFFMTNFKPESFRFYPDLGITLYWNINQTVYIYTGLENWFELATTRADGNPQKNNWLTAPFLGVDIGRGDWQLQLESRLYTPNLSNKGKPTKNLGIGDHGVWGAFLGVNHTFGRKSEWNSND